MSMHENFDEQLERYLAGELPEADRAAFEAALDAGLEAQVFDPAVRPIIDAAHELPKEVAPPNDGWTEIAGRLKARGATGGAGTSGRAPYLRMLAAAGVLVAVGLAVYFGGSGMDMSKVAVTPDAPPAQEVMDWQRDFDGAEEAYREARRALFAELDAREVPLSEETRETLKENVLVIDEAVKEIRVAVEDDPSNPRLMQMLVATREKELNFLETLVRIPAGS